MYFNWSAEVDADLRRYFADGYTGEQIAFELNRAYRAGLSRGAIFGRLRRLGLNHTKDRKPTKPDARAEKGLRAVNPITSRPRRPAPNSERAPEFPSAPLPAAGDPAEVPLEQRRTLLELTNESCRYPYGEPGKPNFFFCGSPTADCAGGQPFCPAHAAISYRRPNNLSEEDRDLRRDAIRGARAMKYKYAAARKRAAA